MGDFAWANRAPGAAGASPLDAGGGAPEPAAPPVACIRGMVDLAAESGLPLWLDPEHTRLVLAQPSQQLEVGSWLPGTPGGEGGAYWLFPDVVLPTDAGVFAEAGVRHNLLLISPRRPGGEYTRIDAHALALPDGTRCGEAYGVVHGRAIFLLQERSEGPGPVPAGPGASAVYWLQALAGDKVLAPPQTAGLGIINTGDQPLVLSNLAARNALPVIEPFAGQEEAYQVRDRQGQPVVELAEGHAGPRPALYHGLPVVQPKLGLVEETPLYSAFVHDPAQFAWLVTGMPVPGSAG